DGSCYEFELVLEDNQTSPAQAIGVNQRFLRDGIQFVYGPSLSVLFAPAFESIKGGALVFTGGEPAVGPLLGTDDGQYLFVTHMPDKAEIGSIRQMTASIVDQFASERVALQSHQDPVGEGYLSERSAKFEEAGGEFASRQEYASETRDI